MDGISQAAKAQTALNTLSADRYIGHKYGRELREIQRALHDRPPPGVVTATVHAGGPVNGMGLPDPDGSYVQVVMLEDHGNNAARVLLSKGAAELLLGELQGTLAK